jgi:hypothetical protein
MTSDRNILLATFTKYHFCWLKTALNIIRYDEIIDFIEIQF